MNFILKIKMFEKYINNEKLKENVFAVFDDRPKVVRFWISD
jgi:hypothetical protein